MSGQHYLSRSARSAYSTNQNYMDGKDHEKNMVDCFICGKQFTKDALSGHEKICLAGIQVCERHEYTRPSNPSESDKSEFQNNEEIGKKKSQICHICGKTIATYQLKTHEKNCKRNWDLGVLNITPTCSVSGSFKKTRSLSASNGNLSARLTPTRAIQHAKSETDFKNMFNFLSVDINQNKTPKVPLPQKTLISAERNTSSSRKIKNSTNPPVFSRSRSTTNVNQKSNGDEFLKPFTAATKSDWKTRSLYDLRKTSDVTSGTTHATATATNQNPQYHACDVCGRLYSVHSIGIHTQQCERTLLKQLDSNQLNPRAKTRSYSVNENRSKMKLNETCRGPNTEEQRKKIKASVQSPASIQSCKQKHKEGPPNAFAIPIQISSSSLSSDHKNCPNIKITSAVECTENERAERNLANKSPDDIVKQRSTSLGAIQKCDICKQIYGSRSLPIHRKQCAIKKQNLKTEKEIKTLNNYPPTQKSRSKSCLSLNTNTNTMHGANQIDICISEYLTPTLRETPLMLSFDSAISTLDGSDVDSLDGEKGDSLEDADEPCRKHQQVHGTSTEEYQSDSLEDIPSSINTNNNYAGGS